MIKKYIFISIILSASNLFAQNVWTVSGSPYHINSDTIIQDLSIEPGVIILFDGDYSFTVEGTLTAIGSEKDSIIFTRAENNPIGWEGITISPSSQNTILSYCVIEQSTNNGTGWFTNNSYYGWSGDLGLKYDF